jgi:TolB-like protein/Flp pilus assembly protein TadD
VLPFVNLGGDIEQGYFADGIVDDIITGLSRIKWLFVIARNSSFAYKGGASDMKQVGRELGVRYLLEGGVRRARDRVRVTAQLIEAETGAHLWADRFDRLLDDIFLVQDEITLSVVGAIEPNLRKVEIERVRRKRPASLDAYDLVMQALPSIYRNTPADATAVMPLLQRALALEPDYAIAHAALAWCHHFRFRADLQASDRAAAVRHARAAVSGGSDDATALAISSLVIFFDEPDATTALNLVERALTLSGSNAFAHSLGSVVLAWMGRPERAIEWAERAIRLSPFDSLNYFAHNGLANACIQMQRYEEARAAALRAIECNPHFFVPLLLLTAALHGLGHREQARVAAQRALELQPGFTIRGYSVTAGFAPTVFTRYAEAWRAAGLPET